MLIRGPEVLETTRRVDTVVLDKTGTVTTGRMSAHRVVATGAGTTATRCSASPPPSRSASEHPVAGAVAEHAAPAASPLPAVTDFANVPGLGVRGTVEAHAVAGRAPGRWPTGVAVPADLEAALDAAAGRGAHHRRSSAGTARRAALLVVDDTVKPTSAEAVAGCGSSACARCC